MGQLISRFVGVRLELPGPPPWSCIVWLPENDDQKSQYIERLESLVRQVVIALETIAPDQVADLRVSSPFHGSE